MAEIRHLENWHDVIFSAEGGPVWIKFCRLVQNDMSTAVIWSKCKPDVEFQHGRRLGKFHGMSSQSHLPHCKVLPPGEFNGMSSQSHVSHCRVLPRSEFTVMIPGPHATLQGVKIYLPYWKSFFCHILFIFWFFNAVWALTSGGFRIISDTLVLQSYGVIVWLSQLIILHIVNEQWRVLWSLKIAIEVLEKSLNCGNPTQCCSGNKHRVPTHLESQGILLVVREFW